MPIQSSAKPVGRQLAFGAARGVDGVLEAVHRDLAEHRRDPVVEAADERSSRRDGSVLGTEQAAEDESLAEHGRRLGERQRGLRVESPAVLGEHAVEPVPELVGERQDRAPLPVKFMRMYGCTPGTRVMQYAPVDLFSRGGASIHLCAKNRSVIPRASGEKSPYAFSTRSRRRPTSPT